MKLFYLFFSLCIFSFSQIQTQQITINKATFLYTTADFLSDKILKIPKDSIVTIYNIKQSIKKRPFFYCLATYKNKKGYIDVTDIKNYEKILIEQKKYLQSILENNCHYHTKELDEFSNTETVITNYYDITDDLQIRLLKIDNNYYVNFYTTAKIGCVSPYLTSKSYAKIKLENNTIITFYHHGNINCSEFILLGKLSKNELQTLTKYNIKTIRLLGTEFYKDFKDIKFKNFFNKKAKCIK